MEPIQHEFFDEPTYQQAVLAAQNYKPWEAFKILEALEAIKEIPSESVVTAIAKDYAERVKQNQNCIVFTSKDALPELETAIRDALKTEPTLTKNEAYAFAVGNSVIGSPGGLGPTPSQRVDCVLLYEHEGCFSNNPDYWHEALAAANQTAVAYTTDKFDFEDALGKAEVLEALHLEQQESFEAYLQDIEDRGQDLEEEMGY